MRLAQLGVRTLRHIYGGVEPDGEGGVRGRCRSAAEMGRRFGAGGKVLRSVRVGAELSGAERREYDRLLTGLTPAEVHWIRAQRGEPCTRPGEPVVATVHDARRDGDGRAAMGGWAGLRGRRPSRETWARACGQP